MRSGAILAVVLTVAAGCVHPGLHLEGGGCASGAMAIDATESEILAVVAQNLYETGEIRIARETALTGNWLHELTPVRLGQGGPKSVSPEALDDLGARNARAACLRFSEKALDLPANDKISQRARLTLSRPGFDATRTKAMVVYRMEVSGSPGYWQSGYVVLRRTAREGWSVFDGVKQLP